MTRYTTPSFFPATWLVADREIRMRLRSKSFIISTAVLMLAILASIVISGLLSANTSATRVAAVGTAIPVVSESGLFEVEEVGSVDEAEELVRSGDVEAAVVPDDASSSPTGVVVIGLEEAPTSVISALSVAPEVQLLEASGNDPFLSYLISVIFGVLFFMAAITFGMTIAQSVIEEKQTRIVEILISTVPAQVLISGKIVGNSILAFAQMLLISAMAIVGLLVSGQDVLLADIGPTIGWFIVYFVAGFVLLAALFAGTAALVSRQEDLGSATSPVMTLVMIPYFGVILFNSNPVVMAIMSYLPFSSPVAMPLRVFLGTAEWWEPLLSLGVLILSTVAAIAFGSRIYRNGLLKMGSKMKLKDAMTTQR